MAAKLFKSSPNATNKKAEGKFFYSMQYQLCIPCTTLYNKLIYSSILVEPVVIIDKTTRQTGADVDSFKPEDDLDNSFLEDSSKPTKTTPAPPAVAESRYYDIY